jgi:hypothetical protein
MAGLSGLPIPSMDWHSPDAAQAFKKFKARCQLYFNGPLKEKTEEEQVSYLLIWSGDDGIELVSTWGLSAGDKKKLDVHWTRFEQYLSPKSNFRLSRFKLRTTKQEPGETVDSFVKKIRILIDECQFTNPDEHIIDTNVISVETYKKLHPTVSCNAKGVPVNLTPSNTVITAYGGHSVSHFGTCVLNLSHEHHSKPYVFHVVDTVGPTILGLPTCTDLHLITLNYSITTQSKELQPLCPKPPSTRNSAAKENLIKRYGDCFEGIGCFQGEFHITLDPSIPPVVHPPRRVPEALREPLKKELDSLVEQGGTAYRLGLRHKE